MDNIYDFFPDILRYRANYHWHIYDYYNQDSANQHSPASDTRNTNPIHTRSTSYNDSGL